METTINLKLETPLVLGYRDPDWPLRPHEIWLLWRWWARALVAGVLFSRGLLRGDRGQYAVKMPTQEEANCIAHVVEKEMGLNYNSCLQTQFEEVEFAPPREVTSSFKHQYGLRQMFQKDEKLWYIDRGSMTLVVGVRDPCPLDNEAVEAAMGALALTLKLSCFGKGGRRGLGCFNVRAYGRHRELFEEKPKALIERAVAAAGAVVNRAVFRCGGLRRGETSPCELPPTPALNTARRYDACVKDSIALTPYMLISVKRVRQDLYSFWQITRSYVDEKEALKTWIIGGTSGRPSPLMLKIGDNTAYLSVFISADWPRELKLGRQRIEIKEADILTATAQALTEFEKLVGEVEMVWPKLKREI
jgi:CRISPR-associated protein Cmr1